MQYVIDASQPSPVEIGASGIRAVLQNVRMILTTVRGSVPLDRLFGLEQTFLDKPLPAAMAAYAGEVVAQVEAQEPRVRVVSVAFRDVGGASGGSMEGRLFPVVTLELAAQI